MHGATHYVVWLLTYNKRSLQRSKSFCYTETNSIMGCPDTHGKKIGGGSIQVNKLFKNYSFIKLYYSESDTLWSLRARKGPPGNMQGTVSGGTHAT